MPHNETLGDHKDLHWLITTTVRLANWSEPWNRWSRKINDRQSSKVFVWMYHSQWAQCIEIFINSLHSYSRLPIAKKAFSNQVDEVPHSVAVNQLFLVSNPSVCLMGLYSKQLWLCDEVYAWAQQDGFSLPTVSAYWHHWLPNCQWQGLHIKPHVFKYSSGWETILH